MDAAASEASEPKDRTDAAYVFKTTADPFAGRITYFKVLSGCVKNDANLQNAHAEHDRAPGAHRRAARQDHPARSTNCTPAISARSPN